MLICMVLTQIMEKIYTPWFKECDDQNIKQYSDKN